MHKKLNLNLNQHSSLRTAHVRVCVSLRMTVMHNKAHNSSDNFPSYPPDNHHSSKVDDLEMVIYYLHSATTDDNVIYNRVPYW